MLHSNCNVSAFLIELLHITYSAPFEETVQSPVSDNQKVKISEKTGQLIKIVLKHHYLL